jgi:hypothetical protein
MRSCTSVSAPSPSLLLPLPISLLYTPSAPAPSAPRSAPRHRARTASSASSAPLAPARWEPVPPSSAAAAATRPRLRAAAAASAVLHARACHRGPAPPRQPREARAWDAARGGRRGVRAHPRPSRSAPSSASAASSDAAAPRLRAATLPSARAAATPTLPSPAAASLPASAATVSGSPAGASRARAPAAAACRAHSAVTPLAVARRVAAPLPPRDALSHCVGVRGRHLHRAGCVRQAAAQHAQRIRVSLQRLLSSEPDRERTRLGIGVFRCAAQRCTCSGQGRCRLACLLLPRAGGIRPARSRCRGHEVEAASKQQMHRLVYCLHRGQAAGCRDELIQEVLQAVLANVGVCVRKWREFLVYAVCVRG